MNNINGKVIQIKFNNDEGELISLMDLCVIDAELEVQQCFYILTINGNIKLYFEYAEINKFSNCLCFYRRGKDLVHVYLPNDEVWTK